MSFDRLNARARPNGFSIDLHRRWVSLFEVLVMSALEAIGVILLVDFTSGLVHWAEDTF